jgi:hypothetical protein
MLGMPIRWMDGDELGRRAAYIAGAAGELCCSHDMPGAPRLCFLSLSLGANVLCVRPR